MLLDVPCTGLGVLSKRADLRWKRKPEDLDTVVKIQAELLKAASKWVKPGGYMVYSTCTIAPEENGDQIQRFLENSTGWEVEPAKFDHELVTPEGYVATVPHKHKVDGAFAVKMRLKAHTP